MSTKIVLLLLSTNCGNIDFVPFVVSGFFFVGGFDVFLQVQETTKLNKHIIKQDLDRGFLGDCNAFIARLFYFHFPQKMYIA